MVCYFFLGGVEMQIWRETDDTLGRWNVGTRPLKIDTAQMPLRQVMIVVRSLRLFERLDVLWETRVV